jgi:hypothetical protein
VEGAEVSPLWRTNQLDRVRRANVRSRTFERGIPRRQTVEMDLRVDSLLQRARRCGCDSKRRRVIWVAREYIESESARSSEVAVHERFSCSLHDDRKGRGTQIDLRQVRPRWDTQIDLRQSVRSRSSLVAFYAAIPPPLTMRSGLRRRLLLAALICGAKRGHCGQMASTQLDENSPG